jgi:hypothetical protein
LSGRPHRVSRSAIVVGVATLLGLLAWVLIQGPGLFSPGGLNAQAKSQTLGGVTSHAQLAGKCGACHAAPWSAKSMSQRCLSCHTDVTAQITGHSGIHGGLVGAMSSSDCRACHSEHRGPAGALTANFDHNRFPFKLTGKHASVPCNQCHTQTAATLQDLRATPQDCYSCHAKNDVHAGKFGKLCGQCHGTGGWGNAKFDHTIFPLSHGSDQQTATCATCHPTSYSAYTCYGCHFHTTASVQAGHEGQNASALSDCIRCHPGGRSADN